MSTHHHTQALLQVEGVTVRFGGLVAIDNVSFDVREGELLGLIGPNGAGKTTMLRSITGVAKPAQGRVLLDGASLNGLPIHQRIRRGLSLSQQLVKPLRGITLEDNVALAAASAKTVTPLRALMNVSCADELAQARHELARVGSSAWRWRVRWRSSRVCCCWTSRWRVSIPKRPMPWPPPSPTSTARA